MADHGIDTTEQLLYFNAERWWKSSREALAIGKSLGEKVIVMGTSNGSTLALILASFYPQDVYALINMSPNIAINNPNAWLLNKPWGLQIARLVTGGKSMSSKPDSAVDRYWNNTYRLEAVTELQELLDDKMSAETFEKITCPSLTLYYYKSEQEQDKRVKVSAILNMHAQLATPDSSKVLKAIPNAGSHVLGSHLMSKDIEGVQLAIKQFAIEKLHMHLRPQE